MNVNAQRDAIIISVYSGAAGDDNHDGDDDGSRCVTRYKHFLIVVVLAYIVFTAAAASSHRPHDIAQAVAHTVLMRGVGPSRRAECGTGDISQSVRANSSQRANREQRTADSQRERERKRHQREWEPTTFDVRSMLGWSILDDVPHTASLSTLHFLIGVFRAMLELFCVALLYCWYAQRQQRRRCWTHEPAEGSDTECYECCGTRWFVITGDAVCLVYIFVMNGWLAGWMAFVVQRSDRLCYGYAFG